MKQPAVLRARLPPSESTGARVDDWGLLPMASGDVGGQGARTMLLRRSTPKAPRADKPPFGDRLGERRIRHRRRSTLYRVVFAVAGLAVLLAGIAMLVLPGPGLLVTAAGLAMLALEFAWAERLLARAAVRLEAVRRRPTRSTPHP